MKYLWDGSWLSQQQLVKLHHLKAVRNPKVTNWEIAEKCYHFNEQLTFSSCSKSLFCPRQLDLTHFSHANLQLSTHLSYCGQLFFSKANTICSYASENKITWAISSHASSHKLTTVEVRKKSQHSQRTGASTPSPIAYGSDGCWKWGDSFGRPNPLRWRSGLYEASLWQAIVVVTNLFSSWNQAYVIGIDYFSFLAEWAVARRIGHTGNLWQSQKWKPSCLTPVICKRTKTSFLSCRKAILMRAAQRGLHVLQMSDSMCGSSEQISFATKPKNRDSIVLLVLSSVNLCTDFFPHLI